MAEVSEFEAALKKSEARLKRSMKAEIAKALNGTPMAAANATSAAATLMPQLIGMGGSSPMLAQALARDPEVFGGALGPGFPFIPMPLDQSPDGRPRPRKLLYDVATNLNVTQKLAQWNILAAAAVQIDIFARAISIRQGDVTKMDWSWDVSKDAINQVMEANNCGYAEAAKIARTANAEEITRLSEFTENPFPQSDRGWEEFITEALWQILVYDGWAVSPQFTLGGKLLGFNTIDARTIKVLLDDYGDFPRPPDPAYQQVLYGFPRGEFLASPNKDLPVYIGGEYNVDERDQLSYFVMNRNMATFPYGFSAVEMALQIGNIYLERERWQLAEYQFGTMASVYLENTASEITPENLSGYNRILNDMLQGSTANRQSHVTLPPDFKALFAPTNEERYKSDKDEDLIKRTCSYFGVDARQFGIVPRAGLGGGKGAAEGEADNTETVSSKPQNKYIERSFMSLCRRYMGASRMVAFNLKNDESTEDEVEVATSSQMYVNAGLKTRNEVRGELGMPLSEQPEADQLAITLSTGVQYLEGTLDAQLNPPEPPTPIIQQIGPSDVKPEPSNTRSGDSGPDGEEGSQGQEPKEGGEPAQSGDKSGTTPAGLKSEITAFVNFVKSCNKRGTYRTFEFATVDADVAQSLNEEGYFITKGARAMPENPVTYFTEKAGLAPHPKFSKRHSEDTAGYKHLKAVAKGHAGFIRSAIVAGASGITAAIDHALGDSTGNDVKEVARQAVLVNVTFDNTVSTQMLGNLYRDAAELGSTYAAQGLGAEAVATSTTEQLLANAGIVLRGIDNTAMGRISTAIADGINAGSSARDIGTAVNAIIDDPLRADVIATTEANRAYNAGFQDQLRAAGQTQFDWITDGDPCPECEAMEGPQDLSVDPPPLHPNCECTTGLVSADS